MFYHISVHILTNSMPGKKRKRLATCIIWTREKFGFEKCGNFISTLLLGCHPANQS